MHEAVSTNYEDSDETVIVGSEDAGQVSQKHSPTINVPGYGKQYSALSGKKLIWGTFGQIFPNLAFIFWVCFRRSVAFRNDKQKSKNCSKDCSTWAASSIILKC